MSNDGFEESADRKRIRELETQVQLLRQKEEVMEKDIQFIKTGLGRVLWVLGGGVVSAVLTWIAGGGLDK